MWKCFWVGETIPKAVEILKTTSSLQQLTIEIYVDPFLADLDEIDRSMHSRASERQCPLYLRILLCITCYRRFYSIIIIFYTEPSYALQLKGIQMWSISLRLQRLKLKWHHICQWQYGKGVSWESVQPFKLHFNILSPLPTSLLFAPPSPFHPFECSAYLNACKYMRLETLWNTKLKDVTLKFVKCAVFVVFCQVSTLCLLF